jgi:hypothetical protein
MAKTYEVGFKKPPKTTQFKKGQSGNPKGRPKGTKNLKTDLEEELQELIQLKEGGKDKRVSKQRALIKALMAKAVKGDTRSANLLLNMILKVLIPDQAEEIDENLSESDLEILEAFKARILTTANAKGKSDA